MTTLEKLLHLNIAKKLWLLAACATLGIIVLTALFLSSERTLILEERKASVRQSVEAVHGILGHFQGLAANGKMSEDDAKRAALETVKALRYSGKE